MKKLVLIMLASIATFASASAMNLREAFAALSNLPNIQIKAPDYNLPVVAEVVNNGRIAAAYNLPAEEILRTGNAAYAILNQVPMSYMINGANNGQVAAFIYTTPAGDGMNNVLIAVMSGYKGMVCFIYGTISDAERTAIQNAPLTIQGINLTLESVLPDGNDFNIIINKGR